MLALIVPVVAVATAVVTLNVTDDTGAAAPAADAVEPRLSVTIENFAFAPDAPPRRGRAPRSR